MAVSDAGLEQLVFLLTELAQDVQYTRYTAFIAAAIVCYDYTVTFDREVELVWKKRWSIIKVVFLWHRYLGLFCAILQAVALTSSRLSDQFCEFWFKWETWGYCALLFSTEIVLILWLWVVYNKRRETLIMMLVLFAGEVAAVVYILIKSFQHLHVTAQMLPGTKYCLPTARPPLFRLLWIPILAYDTLLLLLFMYKGIKSQMSKDIKDGYGVLDMVYKHSLLNVLAIFASYLSCAVIWISGEPGLAQIPVNFALAFSITNCTRLLLNIRRAYYISANDPRRSLASNNMLTGSAAGSSTPIPALPSDAPTLTYDDEDEDGDEEEPRAPTIYACETAPEVWQYELREMKVQVKK